MVSQIVTRLPVLVLLFACTATMAAENCSRENAPPAWLTVERILADAEESADALLNRELVRVWEDRVTCRVQIESAPRHGYELGVMSRKSFRRIQRFLSRQRLERIQHSCKEFTLHSRGYTLIIVSEHLEVFRQECTLGDSSDVEELLELVQGAKLNAYRTRGDRGT